MIEAKICGLKSHEEIEVAARSGATHVGFVFFEPSPRHLRYEQAQPLIAQTPSDVIATALFVKQSPEQVVRQVEALALGGIQLHGSYSVEQVAWIRERVDAQLLMAFGIEGLDDFSKIARYAEFIDRALYDAKPPKGSTRPGGNAARFEWDLLNQVDHPVRWMLAGGLTPDNVAGAVAATRAPGVDVSSGVESSRGVKSLQLIERFLSAVASVS